MHYLQVRQDAAAIVPDWDPVGADIRRAIREKADQAD